ncbi:MAG: Txe/YoeB family addiction module toxin [Candidatus Aminicenantes bacterium]|nr:Txe/YoeB family addiction module toxin [Candidatus Aminicenantes bacterium]
MNFGARSALIPKKREAFFDTDFIKDLAAWIRVDQRTALRLLDIVLAVLQDPFKGIGKPEPLKHVAPNTWSRRLTLEHRLVYLVRKDRIDFLQARYHY